MLDLQANYFRDENAAREKIERLRWPLGPVCGHCGAVGTARKLTCRSSSRARTGLYRCSACRKQFTVTLGTVMESSHIPLHKWLQAIHLLLDARKPVNIRDIELTLGVTYKSAWNLVQHIRDADRRRRIGSK